MPTTQSKAQESTATEPDTTVVGPRHVVLGTDAKDRIHHWDRALETVFAIRDGERTHRQPVAVGDVENWIAFTAEHVG